MLSVAHAASAVEHHIDLTFPESLDYVEVEIRLAYPVRSLKARNAYSDLFLRFPQACDSSEAIDYRDSRLYLYRSVTCLNYRMRLLQKQDRRAFSLNSTTMVSTPAEWLFLPGLRASDSVLITVKKHAQHELSVPWEVIDAGKQTYRLRASPQSADGLVIIGAFEQDYIQHKGTTLRVAYLPGRKIDKPTMRDWLQQTVDNVSQVYGRFPHPSPQIIVSPSASSWSRQRSPVPFGRVVRDYGESVQFYIDQRQSLKQFNADWTATHEFSHLLLPYVKWKNRWLSEGFASYYQNILMARNGFYTEQSAWQKLHDGFMRGKRAVPELSPNAAAQGSWGGTMKIYWSGAALAFLADVQLRELSNHTKSLDTALDALQRCCLPSTRSWSGSQLMRKLDQLSETTVFSDLYTRYANNDEFVPFEQAYAKLGIEIKNQKVVLKSEPKYRKYRASLLEKKENN
ncbi:MAG: hypothetical protein HKN88_08605 [Gammaproteobacteria bacterium]|nr:hypothetical protein [Gammaproteobacteria bacterium]NNC98119.1 hypothetical protein [Gammaproteobacteria bacterium]NNM13183.1 hypothetical protein [Gammaproteobacteria bacterium]